jgi:molybdenum cofactor cytidylyltransferase
LRLWAIVLAAGAGARFGGGKLLAPWRGGVLLDGALSAAFAAPVERVVVVTGADAERVGEVARDFAERRGEGARLKLARAPGPGATAGIAATIRAGIEALPPEADGAFIFLGDMPKVPHGMAARLAETIGDSQAAAPVHKGRRGHPVLFSRRMFPMLMALDGDRGADALLGDRDDRSKGIRVETEDPGVLFDVDTPDDLANG